MIWYQIDQKGWYAIKNNQTKSKLNISITWTFHELQNFTKLKDLQNSISNLFFGKTQNFFKRGTEDLHSDWAAAIGKESDFIFDGVIWINLTQNILYPPWKKEVTNIYNTNNMCVWACMYIFFSFSISFFLPLSLSPSFSYIYIYIYSDRERWLYSNR